jgi:hypothetical protein
MKKSLDNEKKSLSFSREVFGQIAVQNPHLFIDELIGICGFAKILDRNDGTDTKS